MDKDKIFDLFNNPNFDDKSDAEIENSILDSAHFNMKQFMRCVTNIKDYLVKFISVQEYSEKKKKLQESLRKEQVLEYKRAFGFISKINTKNKKHVIDLDLLNPYDMGYCVKVCLEYHKNHENYLEAGYLLKFLNFLEKRYNSLEIE